jgi:parallel beta-helix repeat protein
MTGKRIFIKGAALLIMLAAGRLADAAYNIPSDTSIGTWDPTGMTYTLNQDVSDTIEIDQDNLTLDGRGHTLNGSGSLNGIDVQNRTGVTIVDVNIVGFGSGIYLSNSQDCTVTGSALSENVFGITIYESADCTLTDNVSSDNSFGIYLNNSDQCAVIDNAVLENYFGIDVYHCPESVISGNTVSDNDYGILILFSDDITATNNTISENDTGLRITLSSDGLIYNNNFIQNATQVFVGPDGDNTFNLPAPAGGNYWSNWTGPDNDGDGFVDSPYIFEGGRDNLPWTVPDGWHQPVALINQLIEQVMSLNLSQGTENSLVSKLESAKGPLEDQNPNNDGAAVNSLGAFINAVEAQRGKEVSEQDADSLIAAAQQIIDLLNSQ